jgi:hypothetical protein
LLEPVLVTWLGITRPDWPVNKSRLTPLPCQFRRSMSSNHVALSSPPGRLPLHAVTSHPQLPPSVVTLPLSPMATPLQRFSHIPFLPLFTRPSRTHAAHPLPSPSPLATYRRQGLTRMPQPAGSLLHVCVASRRDLLPFLLCARPSPSPSCHCVPSASCFGWPDTDGIDYSHPKIRVE